MTGSQVHSGTDGKSKDRVLPAERRRSARLSSVQALYQIELSDADPQTVIDEFTARRLSEDAAEIDAAHFASVVTIAREHHDEIDTLIAGALADDWSLNRLGALLRALLRGATAELLHRTDVPAKVVISEYVALSRCFFAGREPAFVNGALDGLT